MVCKIPGPSKRTTPDSSAATSGPGDGERGDEVSGEGAVEAVLGSELEGVDLREHPSVVGMAQAATRNAMIQRSIFGGWLVSQHRAPAPRIHPLM